MLVKIAVTVDHLSAGRLELGIGAAWAEIEHRMLGRGRVLFKKCGWRLSGYVTAGSLGASAGRVAGETKRTERNREHSEALGEGSPNLKH